MSDICKYISLAEGTKSQEAVRAGVANVPNAEQLAAMRLVGTTCFVPLREWHGKPIGITSFFRSPWLNKRVNGSKNSTHMLGEAIDIDADLFNNGISNADIFWWLAEHVVFDQLIWEFGTLENPAWVHVSHRKGNNNRMQALRATKEVVNGKETTIYTPIPI